VPRVHKGLKETKVLREMLGDKVHREVKVLKELKVLKER
jgi:hypothetical protein